MPSAPGGAGLHPAVHALARACPVNLGHQAQGQALVSGTGGGVIREGVPRHGQREAHRGQADAARPLLQRRGQPAHLPLRDFGLEGRREQVGIIVGAGFQPLRQVSHGGFLRPVGPVDVRHHHHGVRAGIHGDVFRGQRPGIVVREAPGDGTVTAEEVKRQGIHRRPGRGLQAHHQPPLPGRQGILPLVRVPVAGDQREGQHHRRQDGDGGFRRCMCHVNRVHCFSSFPLKPKVQPRRRPVSHV